MERPKYGFSLRIHYLLRRCSVFVTVEKFELNLRLALALEFVIFATSAASAGVSGAAYFAVDLSHRVRT